MQRYKNTLFFLSLFIIHTRILQKSLKKNEIHRKLELIQIRFAKWEIKINYKSFKEETTEII
jgi:hypothetical protein